MADAKKRESHIFEREEHDHYVEEEWCSRRLFEEVQFTGPIFDPCCGWGRILDAAAAHNFGTFGADVVDRGASARHRFVISNFLEERTSHEGSDIVGNPPFNQIRAFTDRALARTKAQRRKVAFIFPARRLPAATWLADTPLTAVLYMNPRPSMPTGAYIKAGGKVGGGTQDFCWLIWDHNHHGKASVGWLRRDEGSRG